MEAARLLEDQPEGGLKSEDLLAWKGRNPRIGKHHPLLPGRTHSRPLMGRFFMLERWYILVKQRMKGGDMSEGMSDAEVKAIRWVEHILAPLIVVSIVGLVTFSLNASQTMAELQSKVDQQKATDVDLKDQVKVIATEQKVIISNQRQLERQTDRIEAHQENIKVQVTDLKKQNDEILRILRDYTN